MEFLCNACGKKMNCETKILFCPFCGSSYSSSGEIAKKRDSVRITIGSDSERNIENKYWLLSRECLDSIVSMQREKLDALKSKIKKRIPHISIPYSVDELSDEEITANLEKKIKRYVSRIEKMMDSVELDPNAIRDRGVEIINMIQLEEKEQAEKLCDVAKNLRIQIPLYKIDLEDSLEDFEGEKLHRYSKEIYRSLLGTIQDSTESFISVIKEHDVSFAAEDIKSISYEEAFDIDPVQLATELSDLASKDYDFILGDNPVPFLRTFWKSVVFLAYSINDRMNDICDEANNLPKSIFFDDYTSLMISGLHDSLSKWLEIAGIRLDEIYKSQSTDMMMLYQKLHDAKCGGRTKWDCLTS